MNGSRSTAANARDPAGVNLTPNWTNLVARDKVVACPSARLDKSIPKTVLGYQAYSGCERPGPGACLTPGKGQTSAMIDRSEYPFSAMIVSCTPLVLPP